MNNILITELSRDSGCNVTTIRKWVKSNKISIVLEPASNNKKSQSISLEHATIFKKYWENLGKSPEGYFSVSKLAKECNVDRNTILRWTLDKGIKTIKCDNKTGWPTHFLPECFVVDFKTDYVVSGIPVQEIIDKYKTDWRVAARWIREEGKSFLKLKSPGRRQNGLTVEDARKFENFLTDMKSKGNFYMIQLIPEYNPNRIKFGYAGNVERRLRSHKGACPNMKLIASWNCPRHLEKSAIKNITSKINCKFISEEVVECENYLILLDAANKHFSVK